MESEHALMCRCCRSSPTALLKWAEVSEWNCVLLFCLELAGPLCAGCGGATTVNTSLMRIVQWRPWQLHPLNAAPLGAGSLVDRPIVDCSKELKELTK